jgi:phosphate starvation-inducible PhoH-like protein
MENAEALIEKQIIEIAPLAYMRGRTLENAFIILDEAQNATIDQLKMFLTRMGFHSKMVVTGDISQIDLPNQKKSGLKFCADLLRDLPEVGDIVFDYFDIFYYSIDKQNQANAIHNKYYYVVRHPLVGKIIEKFENANK